MSRSFFGGLVESLFSGRMLMTLLAVMVFQYFFMPGAKKDVVLPALNRDVHFVVHKHVADHEHVYAETPLCEYEFSPEGAVLVGVSFKQHCGKDGNFLRTVHERGVFERDQGAFLLALAEQTPVHYVLEAEQEVSNGVEVVFSAHTANRDWKIVKIFRMFNDSYRVDLELNFVPLKSDASSLVPRVFMPAPFVAEVDKDKIEAGVMPGSDTRIERLSQTGDERWEAPSLVFLEDKYFLHALVGYEPGFLKQVFFKKTSNAGVFSGSSSVDAKKGTASTGLTAICECVTVSDTVKATFSWYCGPKKLKALESVDARLSAFMSFGWFSWIGRVLLQALEWLFDHLGNYGWAIVCLTILLRLLFMPLSMFGKRKALQTENFGKRYASEIAAINARYRDDAATRQTELVKFYESHGVSFFGFLYAVLPGVLSLPIFIGLYGLLNTSLALYNAPFIGWITNLGQPDGYYVLPVLLAMVGFLYQYYSSVGSGKQFQLLGLLVPVFLFAIALWSPAGIVVYLGVNLLMVAFEDALRIKVFGA